MDLVLAEENLPIEDWETRVRNALDEGLPIDWEFFWKIRRGHDSSIYKRVVDLFLHFGILSLEQDGNIVLRYSDATISQTVGNPRHYSIHKVACGHNPLFFRRDRDAVEYIKTGECLGYLVKGYQAQRIKIIE